MNKIVLFLLLFLRIAILFSQTPFPEKGKLYQDTIVPRIDVIFSEDSLEQLLAYENRWSDYHYKADFVYTDTDGSDTILDIGFRLRGNTSRSSKKKSFKVSFNTFESGRKYHGVEKLNLNGEHNDPSIIRAKFCADIAKQLGIVAPRANHVKLYINNNYFGLYINVEHIDEEFVKTRYGNNNGNLYKCLYPADLNYLGNNPDYYKKEANGRRIYDLKINEEQDDYSDLEWFVRVLNTKNGEDFRCELEKIFDVDSYLKIIAFDILTANWDGYIFNKNNFYLYHNTSTDKFEYIPYDVDNTFGIDWFGEDWSKRNIYQWEHSSQRRPLYTNIMKQKVYRSKFTTYMHEIIDSFYILDKLNQYLDSKKELITSAVLTDQYRTLDYGFSFDDFLNSYKEAPGYNHVPIGIKPFLSARRFWTLTQMEIDDLIPQIISESIVVFDDNDSMKVQVEFDNKEFLSQVSFKYNFNGSNQYQELLLNDLGFDGDILANDGIYSSINISILDYDFVNYYYSITDNTAFNYTNPTCDSKMFHFPVSGIQLAINEFMASNDYSISDDNGEFDDWIELYNYGSESIYLGDKYLTDKSDSKSKWKMPNKWISPNEYLLFWADKDEEQGDNHCNFKLSADGEYIGVFNSEASGYELIDEYYFDKQQTDISTGRLPNGLGDFVEMSPTPGYENFSVSTDNMNIDLKVKIIPNPAKSFIEIKLPEIDSPKFDVFITNINGKRVISINNLSKNILLIDISELHSGIYFVNIISKKEHSVSKLLKLK